jgi:PEP-CTERM motif
MRRALLVLAFLAPASPSFADTIYHFTPDRGQPLIFVQLDFASSLPVSPTAPWTLTDAEYPLAIPGASAEAFNGYDATPEGFPPVLTPTDPTVSLPFPAPSSVSSSTGATIDGGGLSLDFSPYDDTMVSFGPGGVSTIDFIYETPSHDLDGFTVTGTWSLGPAVVFPEPASLAMLGLGLAGVGWVAWRKKRSDRLME